MCPSSCFFSKCCSQIRQVSQGGMQGFEDVSAKRERLLSNVVYVYSTILHQVPYQSQSSSILILFLISFFLSLFIFFNFSKFSTVSTWKSVLPHVNMKPRKNISIFTVTRFFLATAAFLPFSVCTSKTDGNTRNRGRAAGDCRSSPRLCFSVTGSTTTAAVNHNTATFFSPLKLTPPAYMSVGFQKFCSLVPTGGDPQRRQYLLGVVRQRRNLLFDRSRQSPGVWQQRVQQTGSEPGNLRPQKPPGGGACP